MEAAWKAACRLTKSSWTESRINEQTWRTLDALHEVAADVKRSPAQVAINWLLQKPGVTAPIIGARRMQQLENNLGAAGWSLSAEDLAKLNSASEVALPYPYDFIAKAGR